MVSRARNTEVDAYVFIKEQLRDLGWDTRNPARHAEGQVYTQNECLNDDEIRKHLVLDKPESIVRLSETRLWVIEAKRDRAQMEQAHSEAVNYALKLNNSTALQAVLVSGVAGNDSDDYLVKSSFMQDGYFQSVTLNGREATGLLSPQIIRILLGTGRAAIADVPVDESLFLASAEKINSYLHDGGINKNVRARVMAALLLSLAGDTQPNVDAEPQVLINDINSRAKSILATNRKEEFYAYVQISLPTSPDNHYNFKGALVKTLRELNNLNIRSAMNSGTDVLGKFYEVFLKYGNGAKEIGIVLTPRHITRFAAEITGVSQQDIVLDPTCGTGGFLVAAFDYVRRNSTPEQTDRFKQNSLFGIEEQSEVVALAIVNMIFRGDGKNNIIEGNLFRKSVVPHTSNGAPTAKFINGEPTNSDRAVTKVLMNPPFALKQSDQMEFRFVQRALDQMSHGGLLFTILPASVLFEEGEQKEWRKNRLLGENTLLSVITFPPELFYPVGVHTLGVVVRKGTPHPAGQRVLWIRAIRDGHAKLKGKRLRHPCEPDDFVQV